MKPGARTITQVSLGTARAYGIGTSSIFFPGTLAVNWIGNGVFGVKLLLIWDASVTGSSLTCPLAPSCMYVWLDVYIVGK